MDMNIKQNNKIEGFWYRIRHLQEFNILAIWLMFFIILSLVEPKFYSFQNITNLLRQTSITGVVAVGMTFVIISAGIDLSVGSVLALGGMSSAMLISFGVPIPLAIILSLIIGTAVGVGTGFLIHKGKVPAFIATLGGMTIIRGLVMLISDAKKVMIPKAFSDFAVLKIFGMPAMVYVWILVVLLGAFIAKYTTFGRNIYAIGSNEEAARLSGIRLGLNFCGIYAFCAFCAAVAGLLMTTRLGSGTPTAGSGMELDAIAAVVVGGASLNGAIGSIYGTVLGTLIIAMIRNGGQLLGINSFVLDISVGGLIVIAVLIDKMTIEKKA